MDKNEIDKLFNQDNSDNQGSENETHDSLVQLSTEKVDEVGMPQAPTFMALYTTLMLLLMTFFIVLVSMGSASLGKFEKTKYSLRSNFNVLGLGGSKQSLYFLYSILKIKSASLKTALSLHTEEEKLEEEEKTPGDGGRIYWEDGLSRDEANQLHRFIALGFNISLSEIDEDNEYLKVTFPQKNIFKNGKAEFYEIFHETLNSLLKMIGSEYSKLFIRVYTSEKPDKELGLNNSLELSALRAQSIASMIVDIQKIEHEKIVPVGYGSYFYNVDEQTNKKNEFIELNIYSLWESKKIDDGKNKILNNESKKE